MRQRGRSRLTDENNTGLIDDNFADVIWDGDLRRNQISVNRHHLPLRIQVEGAGARVERFPAIARHLEPASAVQRQIEFVRRSRQRALNVKVSDRRLAHTQTQSRSFWHRVIAAAARRTSSALGLIQ